MLSAPQFDLAPMPANEEQFFKSLGARIAELGESMNQLTIMFRTAWVGACNARRQAPCDVASRAKVLEIEESLVALIGQAAGEIEKAKGMCDAAGGAVPADPAKKLQIKTCLLKAKASLNGGGT